MNEMVVVLRELERADLRVLEPWFHDPDTERYLGGSGWPTRMIQRGDEAVGEMFRGALQTGAHRYLALADGNAVGYIDCGIFDRCTVYGGQGPDGPIILESTDLPTGSIAFVIDPRLRRRGLGRTMIEALVCRQELRLVELFEAGVEPENVASRRCLEAAGFHLLAGQPDFEGMLYYRLCRSVRALDRSYAP